MSKAYIFGCVKNCSRYLQYVFKNIAVISENFTECKIVIFYDKSDDDSLEKLIDFKNTFPNLEIIVGTQEMSPYRTYNIANARNRLLEHMNADNDPTYEYFIMMDMDDKFSGTVDKTVLGQYLTINDWDALSFNRTPYYDTWAVSIDPYIHSCWHFGIGGEQHMAMLQVRNFTKDALETVNKDELLPCYSAFNAFAIYRRTAFVGCVYEGNAIKTLELINDTIGISHLYNNEAILKKKNCFYDDHHVEDCEHRHFHFQAIKKNGARIVISPLILIGEFPEIH